MAWHLPKFRLGNLNNLWLHSLSVLGSALFGNVPKTLIQAFCSCSAVGKHVKVQLHTYLTGVTFRIGLKQDAFPSYLALPTYFSICVSLDDTSPPLDLKTPVTLPPTVDCRSGIVTTFQLCRSLPRLPPHIPPSINNLPHDPPPPGPTKRPAPSTAP